VPWALHGAAACTSVCWSITRLGGPGGALQWLDHCVAYAVVGYNYRVVVAWVMAAGWSPRGWSSRQRRAFLVCHGAALLFCLEDALRQGLGLPAWLSYGVLHFLWRLAGGWGSLLLVTAPFGAEQATGDRRAGAGAAKRR
jgi:hypothetical protein